MFPCGFTSLSLRHPHKTPKQFEAMSCLVVISWGTQGFYHFMTSFIGGIILFLAEFRSTACTCNVVIQAEMISHFLGWFPMSHLGFGQFLDNMPSVIGQVRIFAGINQGFAMFSCHKQWFWHPFPHFFICFPYLSHAFSRSSIDLHRKSRHHVAPLGVPPSVHPAAPLPPTGHFIEKVSTWRCVFLSVLIF